MKAADVRKELKSMAEPEKAAILQRFFKTGPSQYGKGDIIIGVMVPQSRQVAKKFNQLPLGEVRTLLYSRIHEERLVALLILVRRYSSASGREKVKIVKFYLDHVKQVNNWDLVDLSAPNILGAHLVDSIDRRRLLSSLAGSENVWERRIAIVATHHFIRNGDFSDTLKITEMLLQKRHFSKSTTVSCPGRCSAMRLKGCLRARSAATRKRRSIGGRYSRKYLRHICYLHSCQFEREY